VPADGSDRAVRVERVLALRNFPGLADVDAKNLALVADLIEARSFSKGETILAPGTPVRAMHFIREGTVAILRNGVPARHYTAGDIVGGLAALAGGERGQHVVATTDARTFEVDRDEFADVLEESFPILYATLRGIMRAILNARRSLPVDAGFSAPIPEALRPTPEFSLVERVLFLRKLLAFGRARVEALAELARDMTVVQAQEGAEFFRANDPAPYVLLVWSGIVRCETDKQQVFRLGPDSVVGGIDSIAAQPRWYRAVAETDVVALRGDTASLVDVIEDHPDMGLDMLRSAAHVLLELQGEQDRISLEGLEAASP
jgi:CRP-like cAMP-binding protein